MTGHTAYQRRRGFGILAVQASRWDKHGVGKVNEVEPDNKASDSPPTQSATVLMLRDSPGGLEVLLIKRHGLSDVLGSAYVFPGGKLDRHDDKLVHRLDQPSANLHSLLGEPKLSEMEAGALYVAAIREVFEETGVLFAAVDLDAIRNLWVLVRKNGSFHELMDSADVSLASECLVPWSRWITPVASVMSRKRFDTRFFVAVLPSGQQPLCDEREATESVWLTPSIALSRYWEGQIRLAPPQIMSLAHLARFQSTTGVLADARTRRPPCIQPESILETGARILALPGDPCHPVQSRAVPGPTRLIWRGDRYEPEGGLEALIR